MSLAPPTEYPMLDEDFFLAIFLLDFTADPYTCAPGFTEPDNTTEEAFTILLLKPDTFMLYTFDPDTFDPEITEVEGVNAIESLCDKDVYTQSSTFFSVSEVGSVFSSLFSSSFYS